MNGSHHDSKSSYSLVAVERGVLDVAQAGCGEQLGEMAFPRAVEVGLVEHRRIEGVGDLPERRDRRVPTSVVPDTGGDDATRTHDSSHLAQPGLRVGHEVDDELGQRDIEPAAVERELLGTRLLHLDTGVALAVGGDERRRRIDGRDLVSSQDLDESRGERPWTAADVERRLAGPHTRQLDHLRHELPRVTTHEPVVRLGGHVKRHALTVCPS